MQFKRYFSPFSILAALGVAGLVALLADVLLAVAGHAITPGIFFLLFGLLTVATFLLLRGNRKWALRLLIFLLLLALCAGGLFLCWNRFSKSAGYRSVDDGKTALFGNRKVMLIVPHQDDDLNVLGGMLQEFLAYGSDVTIVFVTNGDYVDTETGLARLQEALTVADYYSLPENHVVFLGYGDDYLDDGPHIYNSGSETVTSHAWNTATYGLPYHPSLHDGTAYTGDNIRSDLYELIVSAMPDTLFVSDYDNHIDHRSVSLLFDNVMGRILQNFPDYEPLVYKSMAYATAYYNTEDFYAVNILSTVNPYSAERIEERPDYVWSNRVRFPVSAASLSRSLISDSLYEAIKLYHSQGAGGRGVSMINGDKVFWQRRTDSLCYNATVTAQSGDTSLLNDFMIIDSADLADTDRPPWDSVWVPADRNATVTFTFDTPQDTSVLYLYDNPDPDCNILNALISFDDGSNLETGPLDPYGTATVIETNKTNVTSFTIQLLSTEGDSAGLAEVEAFSEPEQAAKAPYIKLQDLQDNFAYDYYLGTNGAGSFHLYAQDCDIKLSDCTVSCSNTACQAVLIGEELQVTCPKGDLCVVTVTSPDGTLSDSVLISTPPATALFGQKIEVFFKQFFPGIRYAAVYSILRNLYFGS